MRYCQFARRPARPRCSPRNNSAPTTECTARTRPAAATPPRIRGRTCTPDCCSYQTLAACQCQSRFRTWRGFKCTDGSRPPSPAPASDAHGSPPSLAPYSPACAPLPLPIDPFKFIIYRTRQTTNTILFSTTQSPSSSNDTQRTGVAILRRKSGYHCIVGQL